MEEQKDPAGQADMAVRQRVQAGGAKRHPRGHWNAFLRIPQHFLIITHSLYPMLGLFPVLLTRHGLQPLS